MDRGSASKDGGGGTVEVEYRGVQKQAKGKFSTEIYDLKNKNKVLLGTFATVEEAARAYDRAAYQMRGYMAVLNFPAEHPPLFSAADYNASTMAATAGATESSSSGNAQGREVFEIEYFDNKLLEDLLACDEKKNPK